MKPFAGTDGNLTLPIPAHANASVGAVMMGLTAAAAARKTQMTDLRDKLAAVILANLLEHFKPWTDTREVFHFWVKDLDAQPDKVPHSVSHNLQVIAERLADAVIRELTSPIRGCTDMWHWSTGEPYRCPSCGYWMGEGYV